jgi:hypothetical protein
MLLSAWRRFELDSVSRSYKTPRILDRRITLGSRWIPARLSHTSCRLGLLIAKRHEAANVSIAQPKPSPNK